MATVMFGWELGDGFGHVVPMVQLARDLAARGHSPVLVLKNLTATWPVWRDLGWPVLPAPAFPQQSAPGGYLARRFTDVLALRGYTAVDDLMPMVTAWDHLIEQVRPALIVCDFSPTLQLAAWGEVPVVACGNGFSLPPTDGDDFPVLAANAQDTAAAGLVLEVVREVQRRRGRPLPERVADLGPADRFVTCFPHLDPYQAVRCEPWLGPLGPLPPRSPLPEQASFFAYLSGSYAGVDLGLAAMAEAGLSGQAFVRGLTAEGRARLADRGVAVWDQMESLPDVLPRFSVVVHHGSLGLAHQALAAGRPQLTLPRHLEHSLTAGRLEQLGVGLKLAGRLTPGAVTEAMRRLIAEPSFAAQAQALAAAIASAGPWSARETIVEHCTRRLA